MAHPGSLTPVRVAFLLLLYLLPGCGQTAPPQPMLLWPNGAAGALGTEDVDTPTLTPYPAKGPGAVPSAVIICPGGGYRNLSLSRDGSGVAGWVRHTGVAGFV